MKIWEDMGKIAFKTVLAASPLALAACAGPAIPTPIEGEPVCSDFQVGAAHTKMGGSLRFPVQLVIKRGSIVAFRAILSGRRSDKDAATRILLADDNETYSVEWAQCENERAPRAIEEATRDMKGSAKYECGKAEPYKTDQLTTKKGDPASHALTFVPPPNPVCWQGVAPTEVADAGAPDASAAGAEDAGASAGAEDAGASAGAEDAGAVAADAGAPGDAGAPDSGAAGAGAGADAGTKDAGASKAK